MSLPEVDWGRTFATMAHFYGFRAAEVEALSTDQLRMYMENVGYIRFLRDLATLQYSFSKMDDESIQKMLSNTEAPDPNSLRARGWRAFVASYNALDDDDAREATAPVQRLQIRPETAEAIIKWIESGEMSRGPDGARIWLEDVHLPGLWPRLLQTAAPPT